MLLHIFDGRLITVEYNTLNVQEIISYDEQWDEDKEPTRKFAIHDKFDEYYWLTEYYDPPSRRSSKELNPKLHGYVLCCASEVITKLKDEQQGKDIIKNLAMLIATSSARILFLNEDLSVTEKPKNEDESTN